MTEPESLSPFEHIRRQTHRDIDTICDAWPTALTDAQARGYPTAVMQPYTGTGSELTSVEAAASRPDIAAAWITELADILLTLGLPATPQRPLAAPQSRSNRWDGTNSRQPLHHATERLLHAWPEHTNHTTQRISRLANTARVHWPRTPAKGTTHNGVTVGQRTNIVENCKLCQQPVAGGHEDPIRRIDGDPYHGKSCWYTVTRQRKTA